MVTAIQRAYYREARNPSLVETLTQLAHELGLDVPRFEITLASDECESTLQEEIGRSISLGVRGFPTLVLVNGEAPDFINDMNGDGRYTARDVRMMGYQLVSNQVRINLTLTHENLLTDSQDAKCPPQRSFFQGDVDGNSSQGLLPDCFGTAGSSRSRRIRR